MSTETNIKQEVKKLLDIIEDSDEPLSKLLLKARRLNGKVKNSDLSEFLDGEIDKKYIDDNTPEYRWVDAEPTFKFLAPFNRHEQVHQLNIFPTGALRDNGKSFYDRSLKFSIAEVENAIEQNHPNFRTLFTLAEQEITPEFLNGFFKKNPGWQLVDSWWNHHSSTLHSLLFGAKSRLIDLLSEIEVSLPETHEVEPAKKSNMELDRSKVFIVHGHDEAAKHETARYISKLDLEPIILHEQPSGGKTIIEKIEEHSNVGFGIVLYTACDIGAKKGEEQNLKDRARQNVVFEHGFLMGKIGRKNVAALVKGDIETPGDIGGMVYIAMKTDWKSQLVQELLKAGYDIDVKKVFK